MTKVLVAKTFFVKLEMENQFNPNKVLQGTGKISLSNTCLSIASRHFSEIKIL